MSRRLPTSRPFVPRLLRASLFALLHCSCIHPAGRDVDASLSGVRADVRELSAALWQVRSELRAGGDVNQNDKWTLRLLGLGVLMLGLSYPVGKVVWLASTSLGRRAGISRPEAPPQAGSPLPAAGGNAGEPIPPAAAVGIAAEMFPLRRPAPDRAGQTMVA
jgi:hypothetical protein